jgi:hypothetical protein
MNIHVEVKGLSELRRLLNPPTDLYAKPWAEGMEEFATEGAKQARGGAPVLSGKLLLSIRPAVQKKPMPAWAAIRVKARRRSQSYPEGFPYPRLLAFSRRHNHRDWLIKAVRPLINAIPSRLTAIANQISKRWEG